MQRRIHCRPAGDARLLNDVEAGLWCGVLVMEVERLARGNTTDQGMVADTFKYSGTRIITPAKDYDPADEFDEEYFEFGLFMSRREYKTINRRLQRGRRASLAEGKYIAGKAAYGYERYKLPGEKGYSLRIIPEQAEVVRADLRLVRQRRGTARRVPASARFLYHRQTAGRLRRSRPQRRKVACVYGPGDPGQPHLYRQGPLELSPHRQAHGGRRGDLLPSREP